MKQVENLDVDIHSLVVLVRSFAGSGCCHWFLFSPAAEKPLQSNRSAAAAASAVPLQCSRVRVPLHVGWLMEVDAIDEQP